MMAKMILQILHFFLAADFALAEVDFVVLTVVFLVVVVLAGALTVLVCLGVTDLPAGLVAGFFAGTVLVLVVVVDFLRVSATITPLLNIVLKFYYTRHSWSWQCSLGVSNSIVT